MARSLRPDIPLRCALALTAALAAGAQDVTDEELQFTSGPLFIDGQTNMMRARTPRITQGDLTIVADDALATGFEFDEAGEFRLTGNIRLEVQTAVMEADSAVFTFAGGQLSRGELEGRPVSFSDVDAATQRRVTGQAVKMSYDNVARTLRMIGDASVQLDRREVFGCDLIYDFRAERVTSGSADCEDGFRVIVRRDSEDEAAAPDPPQ
jgi:lipopolysaccharide transport protein LptA